MPAENYWDTFFDPPRILEKLGLDHADGAVEMLSVTEGTQHLLCAEHYGENRCFIAGDVARVVIPTGGLGMRTGIGDATDLAWKLTETLQGWGGPALLESYEAERRQVGQRAARQADPSGPPTPRKFRDSA